MPKTIWIVGSSTVDPGHGPAGLRVADRVADRHRLQSDQRGHDRRRWPLRPGRGRACRRRGPRRPWPWCSGRRPASGRPAVPGGRCPSRSARRRCGPRSRTSRAWSRASAAGRRRRSPGPGSRRASGPTAAASSRRGGSGRPWRSPPCCWRRCAGSRPARPRPPGPSSSSKVSSSTSWARASRRSILLIDHDRLQAALQRLGEHEPRLRHGPLGRVDQQQGPVGHAQHALDLAAEIGVAGRVDEVDLHAPIVEGDVLGQDRDAPLALQVVRVEDAIAHQLAGAELAALTQQAVDQRRLAVVDVGDDGDIADVVATHWCQGPLWGVEMEGTMYYIAMAANAVGRDRAIWGPYGRSASRSVGRTSTSSGTFGRSCQSTSPGFRSNFRRYRLPGGCFT